MLGKFIDNLYVSILRSNMNGRVTFFGFVTYRPSSFDKDLN